jgi:hypothetical protein
MALISFFFNLHVFFSLSALALWHGGKQANTFTSYEIHGELEENSLRG